MAKPPAQPPVRSKANERKQTEPTAARSALFPYLRTVPEHPRFPLFIALAYGIVMLFIGLRAHVVGDYAVETEFFGIFAPEAKRLLHGIMTIDASHGPVYPVVLAAATMLLGNAFVAGIVLAVISAAVMLGLTFALLRRLIGADRSLFVAVAMAVSATFVQFSYSVGPTMLFAAVLTLSAFMILRRQDRSVGDILIAGALAGVACLTRSDAAGAVIALVLGIVIVDPFRLDRNGRLKAAGIFLGGCAVIILPYELYRVAQTGSFFSAEYAVGIAREMYRDRFSDDGAWLAEAAKYHSVFHVIAGDPVLFVRMIVRHLYEQFTGDMARLFGWQVGVFVVPGLILLWQERANRRLMMLFVMVLGLFGILLLSSREAGASLFLIPAYLTLATLTLTWKGLYEYRFWNRVHVGGVAAVVLVLWTFDVSFRFNRENIDAGPKEVVAIAGQFHGAYGEREDGRIVMARMPHVAYYLGMTQTALPSAPNEADLKAAMDTAHASYLFFSVMEAGLLPQCRELLDPRRAPAWLTPVARTVSPPAVLYRLRPESSSAQ